MLRQILRKLSSLIGLALFAVAIWVISKEVNRVGWNTLAQNLLLISHGTLALAFVLTGAAYLLLTSYDVLAFRYIGRDLSRRKIMFAAFLGYAFSNSISMTPSMAIRYRLYSSWGLKAIEITQVFFFHLLSTWLGFLVVGGAILLIEPTSLSSSPVMTFGERRWIGFGLLCLVGVYFVFGQCFKKGLRIKAITLQPPQMRILITQIVVATADWAMVGLIPYVLIHEQLPEGAHLSYFSFLSVFLMAQILQIISHVPGGIGVFEGTILLLLKTGIPPAGILASLLVYRMIYTFFPLAVAAPAFLGFELMRRKREVGSRRTGGQSSNSAPTDPTKT